jgi:hypothetical protein
MNEQKPIIRKTIMYIFFCKNCAPGIRIRLRESIRLDASVNELCNVTESVGHDDASMVSTIEELKLKYYREENGNEVCKLTNDSRRTLLLYLS